jgi:hypothetical protein
MTHPRTADFLRRIFRPYIDRYEARAAFGAAENSIVLSHLLYAGAKAHQFLGGYGTTKSRALIQNMGFSAASLVVP